jgi:hypothetical protein
MPVASNWSGDTLVVFDIVEFSDLDEATIVAYRLVR